MDLKEFDGWRNKCKSWKKCKSVSVQIMKSELGKKGNKWKSKLRNYLM